MLGTEDVSGGSEGAEPEDEDEDDVVFDYTGWTGRLDDATEDWLNRNSDWLPIEEVEIYEAKKELFGIEEATRWWRQNAVPFLRDQTPDEFRAWKQSLSNRKKDQQ